MDPSRHTDVLVQLRGRRELLPPHDDLSGLKERRHLRQSGHAGGNELQVFAELFRARFPERYKQSVNFRRKCLVKTVGI